MTDSDAPLIDPYASGGVTVRSVEVRWEKWDDRYVFAIPDTLQEARSAYAYDPVFNTALTIFCDRKQLRPEEALIENLGCLLHVEPKLMTGVTRIGEEPMPEPAFSTEPSIAELKQMFVDDTIGIAEFERRVEERLE